MNGERMREEPETRGYKEASSTENMDPKPGTAFQARKHEHACLAERGRRSLLCSFMESNEVWEPEDKPASVQTVIR